MIARFIALLLVMGLLVSPAYAQKMSGDSQNIDENGTADVKLKYLLACERLQDQASKGHCAIVDVANLAVISKTTAATIGGGVANDTYLKRVIVLAALTGTCVFTGFADSDGAAQSFTIPAAFVGERNFGGAKNSAGALTITCSNALDDNLVLVEWWPAS